MQKVDLRGIVDPKRAFLSVPAAIGAWVVAEANFRFGAFIPEALAFVAVYFGMVGFISFILQLVGANPTRWTVKRFLVKLPAVGMGLVGTEALGPLGSFTLEIAVFFAIYCVTAIILDTAVGRSPRATTD